MFNLILGGLVIVWIGATASAYRAWGAKGLLGIPIGVIILLGLWLGMARLLSGPSGGL